MVFMFLLNKLVAMVAATDHGGFGCKNVKNSWVSSMSSFTTIARKGYHGMFHSRSWEPK
jgi:hypothetical protein